MGVVKLGDVARESRLKWTKSKQDVPIVGLEHLIPNEIRFDVYDINTDNTFSKRFVKGQVLFGRRRAYQRKAAVAEFDGICSGDITVIEAIEGKIVPELLPFIVQTPVFFDYANRGSAGSLSPRVKWEHLADFEFELPPLEEQKVLADKLWAAYRLKEAYKKLLDATDEMVKSQFIEMYYNTHNKQTLESVCPIMSKGITPKYVESSSVLVINQACIHWDGQRLGNIKYHNEEIPVRKRILESGDVLLNATGNGTLGRCCVFICPSDNNIYINDGHVIALSTDRAVILPEVLNTYLSLNDTQAEIYRQYVTGSTNQVDIVFSDIKKMKVPVPSMDEQILFVEVLTQADKSKFELKQCIDNIDKVIKSLING
ncbi:restriction endonuclease subunit S [Bacteroides acidifaciens]|uniref:restriction endonuclease subunit S n=1 Tax=Bacteroides acidifaciens TaxID=85831 RepID=UPI0025581F8B|nr:restriction endonuclease subunit S [Bacteroides acidifaciens]